MSATDPTHAQLVKAIERREKAYLWVPDHAISFVPRVLPKTYGDGRALFALATLNQRPAYWVIRACSTWGSGLDTKEADGPDFAVMTDDVLIALEDAFGNGRCAYSGSSLFYPKRERRRWCKCEDCAEMPVARWPMVDGYGGCSWCRIDWPKGFATEPNPLSWRGNLLASPADAGPQADPAAEVAAAPQRAPAREAPDEQKHPNPTPQGSERSDEGRDSRSSVASRSLSPKSDTPDQHSAGKEE